MSRYHNYHTNVLYLEILTNRIVMPHISLSWLKNTMWEINISPKFICQFFKWPPWFLCSTSCLPLDKWANSTAVEQCNPEAFILSTEWTSCLRNQCFRQLSLASSLLVEFFFFLPPMFRRRNMYLKYTYGIKYATKKGKCYLVRVL